MKLKLAGAFFFAEITVLFFVIFNSWHTFDLKLINQNMDAYLLSSVTLLLLIITILLRYNYLKQLIFKKRTSHLLETRRLLRMQHEALHTITSNKSVYSGDLSKAIPEISQIAALTLEIPDISIWLFNEDLTKIRYFDSFGNNRDQNHPVSEITKESHPDFFSTLTANRVIAIDDTKIDFSKPELLGQLHHTASSIMIAPIRVNAELVGIVCFCHTNKRIWTTEQQSFAGSIADLFSIALEARERRKIEHELQRRSVALESAVDGMAILNAEEKFTFVNEAFINIFGYNKADDILGGSWKSLYSPIEVQRFTEEITPIFRIQEKIKFEAIGSKRDGTTFPHEVSLTSLDGGGFVCSVTDITERKKAENVYQESKRFLHKVINANPNLIFVKDKEGRFTLVNQAVAEVYGTSIENIIGKTDADFNGLPDEVKNFRSDDQKVIEECREIFVAEEKITDANGNLHWLQTTKRPLLVGAMKEVQVLGVATDITERKKLQDQLVQAQKMEAIGQLAGGIAHDFNNYLTGIIGYTGLLRMGTNRNKEVEHAAEMIENTAKKAALLTEKLLGFARKGKNQNIPVDIHSTINETISLLSRTIEKNITIDLDLKAANAFTLGDPTQIQQVILNLAINARDSMSSTAGSSKNGGRILISTANTNFRNEQKLNTFSADKGDYLAISVNDSGCGIDSKTKEKIFEPFFTTKEPNKGTGMGLAMVYGIVKNHGGNIFVESVPGIGSTFTVYLPASQIRSSLIVEKVSQSATVAGKGHILIVDDHQVIRDVTSRMLSSLGYDVVTAKDGVEALQYFEENNNEIDLVILDMVMPKMGARDCYRAIKKINPKVRAILSTGYDKNNAVQEILNEGIAGFVQKPYQLNKLSEVIAEVLQH